MTPAQVCTMSGCLQKVKARGWCQKHYWRWRTYGDPAVVRQDRTKSAAERYEAKVDRSAGPAGCHPWLAPGEDYGRLKVGEHMFMAHRFGYALYVGPIPPGMQVLHRCDNPPCQNTAHLFLGTNDDNIADKVAKGRQARHTLTRGMRSGSAKLTDDDVRQIRALYAAGGVSQRALAARYGLSQSAIGRLLNRQSWFDIAETA